MVSAFRGLNELVQMRQGNGLIMDWKQSGGTLLVGGDSRIIRVWDAHAETQTVVMCQLVFIPHRSLSSVKDLDTNSDSPVTAIASDPGPSSTFVASFADGTVKVFDRRMEEEDAIVRSFTGEHTSWVQNVRWHPTYASQVLSAR
jgi:regulator-associated protein of mTOR